MEFYFYLLLGPIFIYYPTTDKATEIIGKQHFGEGIYPTQIQVLVDLLKYLVWLLWPPGVPPAANSWPFITVKDDLYLYSKMVHNNINCWGDNFVVIAEI